MANYDSIDITELKIMLGYKSINVKDELLRVLKGRAIKAVSLYIGKAPDMFPPELDFIADEFVTSRLTLLNSEGIKVEKTDITSYEYVGDIYAVWYKWLDRWLREQYAVGSARLFMM